ncbi:hypothetical protein [uncultured Tenacibaculum sp.]|uniref:helix-turn-helix transcriptional regulator n=1 Tax=uncultured Tenacibaculum sp. TaxID=174713 RepID=UPI00262ADDE7|nr:hypothetical protein [uncultured Tenacibaculum sp.]
MNHIKNDILILILLLYFSNANAYEINLAYNNFDSNINITRNDNNNNYKFVTQIFDHNPLKWNLYEKTSDDTFSEKSKNLDLRVLKIRKKFEYLLILFLSVSSILTILLLFIGTKLKNRNTLIKKLEIKEKATLQKQIKRKEEEILATVIVVAEQQKELRQTLNAVEDLKNRKNDPTIQAIYNKLKNITRSSSNLNLIFQKLESQYSNFSTVIKNAHPNLTKNDIRNCILLRLDYSLKDSAELLNVSVHAIKIARQRIKKKISFSENISLKEYLDTFENEISTPKKVEL